MKPTSYDNWLDAPYEPKGPQKGLNGGILIEEDCPDCNGSGVHVCLVCGGDGYDPDDLEDERCFSCGGTGQVGCTTCGGSDIILTEDCND